MEGLLLFMKNNMRKFSINIFGQEYGLPVNKIFSIGRDVKLSGLLDNTATINVSEIRSNLSAEEKESIRISGQITSHQEEVLESYIKRYSHLLTHVLRSYGCEFELNWT